MDEQASSEFVDKDSLVVDFQGALEKLRNALDSKPKHSGDFVAKNWIGLISSLLTCDSKGVEEDDAQTLINGIDEVSLGQE